MFASELGFPQLAPSVPKYDNSGTVAKAAAAASDKRSLYMKRRITFVQEAQALEECSVQHIPSEQNRAHILSEVLKMPLFGAMRAMLHNLTASVMDLVAASRAMVLAEHARRTAYGAPSMGQEGVARSRKVDRSGDHEGGVLAGKR
eukprot:6029983-Prymnesium_polylepis.1